MSNVHGLGSYDRDNDNNNQRPQSQPFPGNRGNPQNPRQQNPRQNPNPVGGRRPSALGLGLGGGGDDNGPSPYPPMNKVLAPNFAKNTFIFWISVLQVIVFILELIVGQIVFGAAFTADNEMGGPSTSTLRIMGGKYLPCLQNGEIFRFFTPALLHAGIIHIFTNLVSQTMIGYTCEYNWGHWRTFCVYFATTFGATLLSTVGGNFCSVSVGASGALLGIIGCYISWILLNWNNRDLLPQPCPRLCTMIVWLIIIFMVGIGLEAYVGIDNMAHLGGLISGLLIGFAFNTFTEPLECLAGSNGQRIKFLRIVATLLTLAYYASTLVVIYFAIDKTCSTSCWAGV